MRLIGVDVGGTFTDVVFCHTEAGRVAVDKVSTTRANPSEGVMAGVLDPCRAEGVESVAVCFLFSSLDLAREDRAAAILRDAMPGARRDHAGLPDGSRTPARLAALRRLEGVDVGMGRHLARR